MMDTIDIRNPHIEDTITTFEKTLIRYKIELKVFETLKSGYKIMKNNTTHILYSEAPSNLQGIKRWWYGEDKEKTWNYLDEMFNEFVKFLDKILHYMRENNYFPRVERLNITIREFIDNIIPGLCSLKYTYPEYAELHCKVASIVITLIDFKKETYRFSKNNTGSYHNNEAKRSQTP